MSDAILEISGLEAGYGEVQVLWGISIAVPHRRLTTIVGANGAGKTTTLKTVVGSIRPWSGRVLFSGEDVTSLPPHAKAARGLVLVPEGRQLFGAMTVEENLQMGAFSKRAARKYADGIEQVFTLFPRLKDAGLTILLVEQNVHLAFAVSEQAYVMAEGRIVTAGAPSALAAMPEIRRAYLGL
jgi:branched-chain amino acid transport system ATP-binding protein